MEVSPQRVTRVMMVDALVGKDHGQRNGVQNARCRSQDVRVFVKGGGTCHRG